MSFIEKVLRWKADDEGCNILVGQWEYDRKLVPEALKAVAVMFPHFSLHDETHSETILDNIVNVLGKDVIESMSCTDLWLLLEAAYCHDLGMVITAAKIHEIFKDGSFLCFFHTLQSDVHHDLNKYTKIFEEKDGKLMFKSQEFKLSAFDAVKFLFAEYFRKQHGVNAGTGILNPLGQLGIDSPRAVIPTRLYELLSKVCTLHTKNFSEIMDLPYIENGISLDKAHPRFVACLLRIGDLLDLDNHRFNETLIRTLDEMPANSLEHRAKHHSITHYRVDNKYVEVSAICKNPKVARITRQWFDWIKEEFNNQTQKWNDIVPEEINCYLPTVNQLSVDIEGYLSVEADDEPKFTIDVDKALELLQGKNFYKSPFDSIREVLQNAVDSTLIRLFLEAEDDGDVPSSPNAEFLKRASNYPIRVSISRTEDKKLQVVVDDCGMGLKRSHLRFLSNTGSSSRNIEKRMIVSRMPDWLRPSGIFGIGFQSVFLLTEEIRIQTKDYQTDDCYAIEMHKPNSKMNGDIYLRPLKNRKKSGLKIEFILSDKWSNKPISQDSFSGIDTDEVENTLAKSIKNFAEMSFIPVYLNGKLIERRKMVYYDKDTGVELSFDHLALTPDYRTTSYYFKNARVESNGPSIPFVHPTVNILTGSAQNYLSLDRNSFDTDRTETIKNKVVKAIHKFMFSDDYDLLVGQNGFAKILFSLFAKEYNLSIDETKVLPNSQLGFQILHTNLNIEKMLSYKEVTLNTVSNQLISMEEDPESSTCKVEASMVMLPQLAIIDEFYSLLFILLGEKHKHCICKRLTSAGFIAGGEFLFTDDDTKDTDITIEQVDRLLHISEKREYILYVKGYDALRIPTDKALDDKIPIHSNTSKGAPKRVEKILSPFLKINGVSYDCRTDSFYEYVSKFNGKNVNDIRLCYDQFVADCQQHGIKFQKYVFSK